MKTGMCLVATLTLMGPLCAAADVEDVSWRVTEETVEEDGLRSLNGGDGVTEFGVYALPRRRRRRTLKRIKRAGELARDEAREETRHQHAVEALDRRRRGLGPRF